MSDRSFASGLGNLVDRAWNALLRVRVISLAVLVFVAVLVVTLISLGDDDNDVRSGSTVVAETGRPVAVDSAPRTYRIVYRVENRAAGEHVVTSEELVTRRPFDGRLVERDGDPPGERGADTVTVTRFGRFAITPANAEPIVLHVPPNPPAGDVQPLPALNAALAEGLIEVRERRRIEAVDRECQIYRLGGPLGGAEITPLGAAEGEHADVCVDASGFVLEEVWFVNGGRRILNRRLAVDVDESPTIREGLFELPDVEPPPADQGGGSILEVAPDSRPPGTFFEVADELPGYRYEGRFAVIPPQAEAFADPSRFAQRTAGVVDVWVDGPDMVVVDQGGTLGQVPAFPDPVPDTPRVDLGELGEGHVVLGARTTEVRVLRDEGRYLRVYGTVDVDELVKVARLLRPREGGELVYLDEPPA